MKKLVSLTLVLAMMFSFSASAMAAGNEIQVEVLARKDNPDGTFVEISKIGDILYYFERNYDEVISMSLVQDEVQLFVSKNSSKTKVDTITIKNSNFEEVLQLYKKNELTLSENTFESIVNNTSYERSINYSDIENLAIEKMKETWGVPYYKMMMHGEVKGSTQCFIYETLSYHAVEGGTVVVEAGITIAAAAAIAKVSTSVITKLFPVTYNAKIAEYVIAAALALETAEGETNFTQTAYTGYTKEDSVYQVAAADAYTYLALSTSFCEDGILQQLTHTRDGLFDNFEALAASAFEMAGV